MTWVLLLVLHTGTPYMSNGAQIESVHGFATEAACGAAGEKVTKHIKGITWKALQFVCVATDEQPPQISAVTGQVVP